MDRDVLAWQPFRLALGALAVAAVLAGWTLVRAVRLEPVPDAPPPTFASAGDLASHAQSPHASVSDAVARDLFSPDRTAPAERYRVPGEADDTPKVVVESFVPVVLGTGVSGGGRSFATCQIGDGAPMIVRAGDTIGDYKVKSIGRGRVVFTTANGKQLEVPALSPGS